ncbi:hypothetical protein AWB69_04684 [Caballeronia udeis]|uniref:Uncharacterized protein n=1 Tax=Caballeronia udeis TaxID=1232866 RepID=A0A158HQE6_9BURK|nr:hypothetical protein AWB69_04684 [Caballeronia udeis]
MHVVDRQSRPRLRWVTACQGTFGVQSSFDGVHLIKRITKYISIVEKHAGTGDPEQLSKALESLQQTTPITVLLGEQNVTFALPHADRVYVLEHARLIWEGNPGRFAKEMGRGYLETEVANGSSVHPACE